MENFNFQDFLDTLTEEQRSALLACKTEEELEQAIDDYDIDIPDEMLVEVAGGKGKLIPTLLAGIIVLSGAAATMGSVTASAAEDFEVVSVLQENDNSFQKYGAYIGEHTEEKDKIDNYFDSLDYDESTLFLSHMETDGLTKTSLVKNSDGTTYLVQKRRTTEHLTPSSFGVSNADVNVIYPGALLAVDENLVTGNPTPLVFNRNNIKIGIADANVRDNMSVTTTVDPTRFSGVYDGINEIKQRFRADTDFAAQTTAKIEKVESSEQIKAKMNFSQEMWGSLKISAESDYQTKQQAVVVDISQVFYTVNADLATSADLFADSVTVEDVKKQITSQTPAVMVSSVDYGKRIVAYIQTDDMNFDLKAAVEASGLGGKVSGDAEAEYHSKLSQCKVRVYVLGGSSSNSGKFITTNMDDLLKIASESTGYDGYVKPVSYTTRYAKSGRIATTNYYGDTWETDATVVRQATDLKISADPSLHMTDWNKGVIQIYGKRIKSIDKNGRIEAGAEELIDTITIDYAGKINANIPGDVLLESVKIKVDYEGKSNKAFASGSGNTYVPCVLDPSISNGQSRTTGISVRFCAVNGNIVHAFALTDASGKATAKIRFGSGKNQTYDDSISYCAHVQYEGWMKSVTSNYEEVKTAGTMGRSLRMEAIKIDLKNPDGTSAVKYRAYCQNHGWLDWKKSGEEAGLAGQQLRVEALQIKLDGDYAGLYNVEYRVYSQNKGWGEWKKNGETAGTTGESLRAEAFEVRLVPIL